MKIYIDNISLNNTLNSLKKIDKYITNINNCINAYSTEGIYEISQAIFNQYIIYQINYNDKKILRENIIINNNNCQFTIDYSITDKTLVNYVPINHILTLTKTLIYKLTYNSCVKMIIIINTNCNNNKIKHNNYQLSEINIIDIYFECCDTININDIFNTEIKNWVSLLT